MPTSKVSRLLQLSHATFHEAETIMIFSTVLCMDNMTLIFRLAYLTLTRRSGWFVPMSLISGAKPFSNRISSRLFCSLEKKVVPKLTFIKIRLFVCFVLNLVLILRSP